MKTEVFNENSAVGRGWNSVVLHQTENGWYRDGKIATPSGYIQVYSEQDHTSFRFIYKGRFYMRTYCRHFSGRGLSMKAKQFINETIANVDSNYGV